MAQVVRTTNQLIINSLMLIGELGVGEIPDGYMLATGLDLINELLDAWSADSIYIPYLTTLDHQFIVGKDTYSISDMLLGTDITADRVVDLTFANYAVPGTGINQNNNPISFTNRQAMALEIVPAALQGDDVGVGLPDQGFQSLVAVTLDVAGEHADVGEPRGETLPRGCRIRRADRGPRSRRRPAAPGFDAERPGPTARAAPAAAGRASGGRRARAWRPTSDHRPSA